ncbi:3-hydroxyanthranilate 3,4-dioxygenase [Leucobacter triazinivorans]|uniref:3-hydroxyanthranilate 3,4-dioxygenase n=1 Tax=Leucobacter triazinivorans TaxID=1784719 RepID=A0A4P6KDH1_9MICO|nr:3-hydroxyanthranilate 3,4-dioxygenase [Leucobacter triazinivorans]QBE47961.1 3-hydroxyanthranilate 3,4-dioxygenase [Leucobacter triazinivorans]
MSTPVPPVMNLQKWLAENAHLLQPPVNNKQIFPLSEDYILMLVGGPNQRHDWHNEPYEEWFYQIKGNAHVLVQGESGAERIDIREGEMWLLPRNTWHSPQRPEADSLGLVVERVRAAGTTEKFGWFCENCNFLLHEVSVQLENIETDLPVVYNEFHDDLSKRECPGCGTLHPGKG